MLVEKIRIMRSPIKLTGAIYDKTGKIITTRYDVIKEAIKDFQTNEFFKIQRRYYGIKNYAGFGDQRNDCEYGYGPRHGSIVFQIEIVNKSEPTEDMINNAIYYLLKLVEFGTIYEPDGYRFYERNLDYYINKEHKYLNEIYEINKRISDKPTDIELNELLELSGS